MGSGHSIGTLISPMLSHVVARGKCWHQTGVENGQLDPGEAFKELQASVGSLIFYWCRLEDAVAAGLRAERGDERTKIGISFNDQLGQLCRLLDERFRDQEAFRAALRDLAARIDSARQRRNLIVHCFAGASSDPLKGHPHIICRAQERSGPKSTKITQSELSALLQQIDRCRCDVTCLSQGVLPLQR